jgi:hypothetical protein
MILLYSLLRRLAIGPKSYNDEAIDMTSERKLVRELTRATVIAPVKARNASAGVRVGRWNSRQSGAGCDRPGSSRLFTCCFESEHRTVRRNCASNQTQVRAARARWAAVQRAIAQDYAPAEPILTYGSVDGPTNGIDHASQHALQAFESFQFQTRGTCRARSKSELRKSHA